MSAPGHIVQLSVSNGGAPKRAVETARVTALGLEGDAHRNRQHHGGPERAVCLFAVELIHALQAEGHSLVPGTLGENVTLEGVEWAAVQPGARLSLGDEVVLEVTRYTSPCFNLRPAFHGGDYSLVSQKRHPGRSRVYARVVTEGTLRRGDPARLFAR